MAKPYSALAHRVLIWLSVLVFAVTLGLTWLVANHTERLLEEQAIAALKDQVAARTSRDTQPFVIAQANTYQLRDEYQRRLLQPPAADLRARFDHWFTQYGDGLVRVRPELDNHKRQASVYIRKGIELDDSIRQQVLVAFELLNSWGPPMTARYFSTYIDLPGIALIMYSPGVNWGALADASSNNFDYPPVRNSAPDRNPERKNAWTEVYYDDKAKLWMLSTITPVDVNGQWVATASQDVAVDVLMQQITQEHMPDAYNLLLAEGGYLLAHPTLFDKIAQSNGSLKLAELFDPELSDIAELAYQTGAGAVVRTSTNGQSLLAIARINGPNWLMVTVYPRTVMAQKAVAAARTVLMVGGVALLIELLVFYWIIRRQIAKPLLELQQAAQRIAAGITAGGSKAGDDADSYAPLPVRHNDELGHLAAAFNHMQTAVRERDHLMHEHAQQLQQQVYERLQAEQQAQQAAHKLALATQAARLGIWDWDVRSDQMEWDGQMCALFGFSLRPRVAISDMTRAVHELDRADFSRALDEAMHAPRPYLEIIFRVALADEQIRYLHAYGQISFDEQGHSVRATGVVADISAQKQAEEKIMHLATHDELTGLANRSLGLDRLESALLAAERLNRCVAVLFIDLDRFKNVNDTLGHNAGDELLRSTALRIQSALRKVDTLARLGGDEFLVVLPFLQHRADAIVVAEKIIAHIAHETRVDTYSLHTTASIGIACYPDDASDVESLVRFADTAMYRAKQSGKNSLQCYSADMSEQAVTALRLETEIRDGLNTGQFILYFQPKCLTSDGSVIGAEALLRWPRPGQGMLGPDKFIPVAEDRGLIQVLNHYVLKLALQHLQNWQAAGLALLPISINLSAGHFVRADLVMEISTLLAEYQIAPQLLVFEITESAILLNEKVVAENLRQLRALGIRISVDDFGTGYSSLSYLHRFPIDEIKIDRSFIQTIEHEHSDAPLVSAIIGIAHSLRLEIVAEGVESEAQRQYLHER